MSHALAKSSVQPIGCRQLSFGGGHAAAPISWCSRRRGGVAAAWPIAAAGQQKPLVIGFLGAGAALTSAPLIEALKQGLRENGLIEGKDYALDPRWGEGHYDRFPTFARELADQGVRVVIVHTIAEMRPSSPARLYEPTMPLPR
jgi:hypothetical protein